MPSSPNAIISLPGLRKEAGSRASAGMCQGSSGPAIKRHSASKSVVERRRTSPQRQQNASPEEVGSGGIGSMSGALEPWALGAPVRVVGRPPRRGQNGCPNGRRPQILGSIHSCGP